MAVSTRIAPCLWFDHQAEEAANYYVSIFKNAKIVNVLRYPKAGQEIHHQPEGAVMVVDFELDGQRISGLNGGPIFKFTEAISLQVYCDTQDEIDHYWDKLGAGGDPKAQQCGWLKDKYGLSWQIVPRSMPDYMQDHTSPQAQRAMAAMMTMKKIDIKAFETAVREGSTGS